MGYWLEDERGFVGDLASIGGMAELREYASGQKLAKLTDLIESGAADLEPGLLTEVETSIETAIGPVKATLDNLYALLQKAEGSAIIMDGTGGDEPSSWPKSSD